MFVDPIGSKKLYKLRHQYNNIQIHKKYNISKYIQNLELFNKTL